VAFAAAGAGGFVTARAAAGGLGPTGCGPTQCIPTLSPDAVIAALEERGFECAAPEGATAADTTSPTTCELTIGGARYDARVLSTDGLISSYEIDVSRNPELPPSPRAAGFLTWFAVLPFGDDPEAESMAERWLSEHVDGGEGAAVAIRGYEYRLFAPQRLSPELHRVHFVVQAWPDPGGMVEPQAVEGGSQ
jgi:hypothetical protein